MISKERGEHCEKLKTIKILTLYRNKIKFIFVGTF